jgi:hypothetical protein
MLFEFIYYAESLSTHLHGRIALVCTHDPPASSPFPLPYVAFITQENLGSLKLPTNSGLHLAPGAFA